MFSGSISTGISSSSIEKLSGGGEACGEAAAVGDIGTSDIDSDPSMASIGRELFSCLFASGSAKILFSFSVELRVEKYHATVSNANITGTTTATIITTVDPLGLFLIVFCFSDETFGSIRV